MNMMIAWYFATALAKQYEKALPYIEEKRLDDWTHNKAIQKSCESYRITPEQKAYLRTLKVKKPGHKKIIQRNSYEQDNRNQRFSEPGAGCLCKAFGGTALRACEPKPGLFIAESPRVIERAIQAGYCPVSFLAEKRS